MTEDATLDEFVSRGSDGDDERDTDDEPERDPPGSTADRDEPADGTDAATDDGDGEPTVQPAVSTYRAAPDGRPCADCGDGATELWRDGDDLVCPDCKRWTR